MKKNLRLYKRNYSKANVLKTVQAVVYIACAVTALLILSDYERPEHYSFLWVLPLSYTLSLMAFSRWNRSVTLAVSTGLFYSIYFVRLVVSPFFMWAGDYSTYAFDEVISTTMNRALLITCWEVGVLTIVLTIVNQRLALRQYNLKNSRIHNDATLNCHLPKLLPWLLFMGIVYFVVIMLATPNYFRASFFTILGPSREVRALRGSGLVSKDAFGLSKGFIFVTIAMKVFWVLHILVPPFLIQLVFKRVKRSKYRSLLIIVIICMTALIATEYRSNSIQAALAVLIAAKAMYKGKFQVNLALVFLLVAGLAAIGLASKSISYIGDVRIFPDISKTITAYFNGPQYLASAITAKHDSGLLGIHKIISDVFFRLPLANRLYPGFQGLSSSQIYNQYFGDGNLKMILPSIGMGYIYFGSIFAPIVPGIALYLSMSFERKSILAKNLVEKTLNIMGIIMMARAMSMSSMLSGVTYLLDYFYAWIVIFASVYFQNRTMIESVEDSNE